MKQQIAELFNTAFISIKNTSSEVGPFEYIRILVNVLENSKVLIKDDLSFNELVRELEGIIVNRFDKSIANGLSELVEPVLKQFRKAKNAVPANVITESKLPPPSNKPLLTTQQSS